MYKTILFVALCCAALTAVDGAFSNNDASSFVADLSNPIYGDFSVVFQINQKAKAPFASLAGVFNCFEGDSSCAWTHFNIYSGNIDLFGTPYSDAVPFFANGGLAFAIDASPFNVAVDFDGNFDVSQLQQSGLFAVLSGSSDSTQFVGPFLSFHYFGIGQTLKFQGSQRNVASREGDITYDTFSGSLQYDNGRALISASVSKHSNNKSPYPNVNIEGASLQIFSQYADADDFDGLLLGEFALTNNKVSNAEWATSFEAVYGARNGFLNFYIVNADSSLYLRGQLTTYAEDNQNTIQH